MTPLIQFKKSTVALLIPVVLACFALLPQVQAVVPPPDGGYPNGNTAEGQNALFSLTTGQFNTAIGDNALYSNSIGSYNTANGDSALWSNTTGSYNTASGFVALFNNTGGNYNTATGHAALFNNTTGSYNTGAGVNALYRNTDGSNNTAAGFGALFKNIASDNTANGLERSISTQPATATRPLVRRHCSTIQSAPRIQPRVPAHFFTILLGLTLWRPITTRRQVFRRSIAM